MRWKKLSTKNIYKDKWMTVTQDVVLNENGEKLLYGIVHKEPFALVIPWDGESFFLVGQYRYAVDFFSWEFPAGHYEHEKIEHTARAELEEEAGLKAGKMEKIGSFHPANSFLAQECHVFLATELSRGKIGREKGEARMQVKRVSLEEMEDMVTKGEIMDGPTICALELLKNYLKKNQRE